MSNVFIFRQPPPGFISEYAGGGGKGGTTTSTQTVQIPPEVLARYNAVNARAEQVAQQPFQPYGGEFVAPLTPTQTAGIQATNAAAGQAQPYYGAATQGLLGAQQGGAGYINAATGAALAGAAPITPGSLQTQQFMNPYTRDVVGATQAALGQQFGQQQAQQQAEAIRAGAYGGDRAGLQRQTLRGQQALAGAQAIAPLYQQGYQQAQQTGLQVAQANRAALQGLGTQLAGLGQQGYAMGAGTAQQLAGLGTGAQQAALQGAQAQLAAGQIQQQTQQAQDTAQYQQFLQERGYPFQVAQFLANIAMGTGALSGSTTTGTTTQPGGFFSDKRLKKDVKEIGETHDGQPIYSYKYKGDDRTQIGLMAQDVEKKHPEAVGLMGGYKTVDYKKATEDAERSHKDMGGGLIPDGFDASSMGGAVTPDMSGEGFERGGYVGGGLVGNEDWARIIAANKEALGVYGGQQPLGGAPGATGIVPAANIPVPKPIEAAKLTMPAQRPSGLSSAVQTGKDIAGVYKGGKEFLYGSKADESSGLLGSKGVSSNEGWYDKAKDLFKAEGGLIVSRHAYAYGGGDDSQAEEAIPYDPSDVMRGRDPMEGVLKAGSQRPQQLKAAQMSMSGSGGGGGLLGAAKDVAGLVGAGKTLFDAGTAIASFLPFSDARAKDNIRPVGKTFDGQNIYSYNIGEGPTQMGLMAQEVLKRKPEAVGRRGEYLTVDYDRATEDATPFAYGGLVPRQGYDDGGPADAPSLDKDPTLGLISKFEGFRERPYWDVNALRTGFGSDTITLPDGSVQRVNENTRVSVEDAKRDLARRAGEFQGHIKGAVGEESWSKLDPNSQAALTSVTYNYGRLPKSVVEAVQSGDKASIAAAVNALGTHNQGVNARRRAEEASLIDPEGKYTASSAAPRPPWLIGAGMQPASPPSGAGEKKSLGDVVTSEGFIVPALGFLGSMLASNRSNLGQALGEGIMGGVGAYQAQRKEIPATAKVVEETRALSQKTDLELVDRLLKFNQVRVARGQPPITSLDEFKKKLADGSIIETPSQAGQAGQAQPPAAPQPGAAQPASGAPSISNANDATERTLASPPVQQAMSQINWNNVAPSHNIPQIQAEIETTKRLAETATDPATLQQLQEKQAILRGEIQKILESKTLIDRNGSPFVPPEWQKAANQIESQKTKAVKDADAYAAMEQDLRTNQAAMPGVQQKFENLGKILTNYQTGKLENFKTFVPAIAQAVGIQVDPDKIKTREDFEKFVKESRDLLFQQLKQVGGRILVTEVQRMQEAVVDPELQPGANRSLIASGKAATNYTQDFYDHYRGWKRDNPYATVDDFADMQREWQTKNKLQKYITEAEANTPVRGDFPPPNKRKDGYQYIVDTPEVRNHVVDGKRVSPNGFIGRWNAREGKFIPEKVL